MNNANGDDGDDEQIYYKSDDDVTADYELKVPFWGGGIVITSIDALL